MSISESLQSHLSHPSSVYNKRGSFTFLNQLSAYFVLFGFSPQGFFALPNHPLILFNALHIPCINICINHTSCIIKKITGHRNANKCIGMIIALSKNFIRVKKKLSNMNIGTNLY